MRLTTSIKALNLSILKSYVFSLQIVCFSLSTLSYLLEFIDFKRLRTFIFIVTERL